MCRMIPMGFMAKRNLKPPKALGIEGITDVYSVNDCVNDNFADFVDDWKHNGFWFFDSPEIIRALAADKSVDLGGTTLFYYGAYEFEFTGKEWRTFSTFPEMGTAVAPPEQKHLEGFDVVSVWPENSPDPEHSPLSCNAVAKVLHVNEHCLLETLEEAKARLSDGSFDGCCGSGAFRIFAVYTVR